MNHPPTFKDRAQALIAEFAETRRVQAGNLLLTVYGDTVCPYGGTIWLGSLIKLVEPLGISERLVRTAVYRLTEQGILRSQQSGRRSYYTLTERGQRQFQSASQRIYLQALPEWDGQWRLVISALGELETEQRDALRKELIWLGFSRLSAGFYVHPSADLGAVRDMLDDRQLSEQVALLHAAADDPAHAHTGNRLIRNSFATAETDAAYAGFLETFEPIHKAARKAEQLDHELCFLVRTLLIHRYRYILLREPELPRELLPAEALSVRARRMTAELYGLLGAQADRHFLQVAESSDGLFSQPQAGYYRRFA
ncbi:MAG: phenylacetic acid degradation operon negative regulatory protein PaaX [Thiolinea sp.]